MTTDTVAPRKRGTGLNPSKARKDEAIGEGFFVFRRGKRTGRIRPAQWPFEHRNLAYAMAEANRLAAAQPGETFVVVSQCFTACVPAAGAGEGA